MTTRYRLIFIMLTGIVFLNLIVKFYFIDLQEKTINRLHKELVAKEKPPSVSETDKTDSERYLWFRKNINKVISDVPHIFSLTEHADKIRILIGKNRLTSIKTITLKPEKYGRLDLEKCSTTISVQGDYKGLRGLIRDLQNLPELLTLDSIVFSRSSENRKVISLTLVVSIYFKSKLNE